MTSAAPSRVLENTIELMARVRCSQCTRTDMLVFGGQHRGPPWVKFLGVVVPVSTPCGWTLTPDGDELTCPVCTEDCKDCKE